MLVPLITSGCTVAKSNFWNAIFLYHDRPHIVNRKLSGCALVHFYKIEFNNPAITLNELLTYIAITYETNKLTELNKASLENLVRSILEPYDKNVVIQSVGLENGKESLDGTFISVKILYASNPKSSNCVEIAVLEKHINRATFVAATTQNKYSSIAPSFPYTIEFVESGHVRVVIDLEDADSSSAEWLDEKLFPKLMKWAQEYDQQQVTQQSLSLISMERYCQLYKELKEKYGQHMVQIWPENTDPLKFVYEDVAIATYLICLWQTTHPNNKPSFVDLGCGNGLLVYILASEGFPGFGIDVRKRKIWDLYPENVNLQEQTIIPSESSLFPNTDWIIGNHSDELTPWIPVIAARSSETTNFFVLPCCSYDFTGRKYIRKNPNKSQYNEYLDYIENLSKQCGFEVKIDKLRIPSTKRTCLVSFNRTYNDFKKVNEEITNFINQRCGLNADNGNWAKDFQPRESTEKVRNCTQLNRDLIDKIILTVMGELLKSENLMKKGVCDRWNSGGTLPLSKLIKSLDPEDLKELKKECGGLQTLLRNHRYIFEVAQGSVKLRVPPLRSVVDKYKDKPCWFLKNHPDGCLHVDNCGYCH